MMASASGTRRLTSTEQQRLLESFYEEIYREKRHFSDEDLSQFEEEYDDVDNDSGIDNEDEDFVIGEVENDDPNWDIDAEPDKSDDEPLVTQNIPRNQKFGSQSGVTNSENFENVLEQTSAEYVWSNKAGEHEEWQTQTPTSNTNPKRAGRRSAKDLPLPGGPTRIAKEKATSPAAVWSLMIPDDVLLKVVNYSNIKITQFFCTSWGKNL